MQLHPVGYRKASEDSEKPMEKTAQAAPSASEVKTAAYGNDPLNQPNYTSDKPASNSVQEFAQAVSQGVMTFQQVEQLRPDLAPQVHAWMEQLGRKQQEGNREALPDARQVPPPAQQAPQPVSAMTGAQASWVRKHCKFAQGNDLILGLAEQLKARGVKDYNEIVFEISQGKIPLPAGGDTKSYADDIWAAMGGATPANRMQEQQAQQPQAPAWDPRSQARQQNAPMDPDMQNWYNSKPKKY